MEPIARTIYLSGLLDTYGLFLTERQRLVLSRHLDEDLSRQEIAEQEGKMCIRDRSAGRPGPDRTPAGR